MTALVRPPMKPINTAEAASRLVFQYDDLGTVGGLHIAADLSRDLGPDFPGPWSSRFLGPLSPRFLGLGPLGSSDLAPLPGPSEKSQMASQSMPRCMVSRGVGIT